MKSQQLSSIVKSIIREEVNNSIREARLEEIPEMPEFDKFDKENPGWRTTTLAKKAWDIANRVATNREVIRAYRKEGSSTKRLYPKDPLISDIRRKYLSQSEKNIVKDFEYEPGSASFSHLLRAAVNLDLDKGLDPVEDIPQEKDQELEKSTDRSTLMDKIRARNLEEVPDHLPDLEYESMYDRKNPGWQSHAIVKIIWDICNKIAIDSSIKDLYRYKKQPTKKLKIIPSDSQDIVRDFISNNLSSFEKKAIKRYMEEYRFTPGDIYPKFSELLRAAINLDTGRI